MNQLISSWLTTLNGIGGAFWSYAAGMFVQSGVLILSLLAIDFLLRKRVRATFRYWMWMLVFIKLILPPTLSLPTGIGYWFGDHLFADSIVLDRPSDTALSEPVAVPAPEHRAISAEIPLARPSEINHQPITPAAPAASSVPPITWRAIIFLLWLAGVSIISILVVRRIGFVRRAIAQSASAEDQLLDVLNQCRRELGVRQDIQLRLSTGMPSPAVCGLFKPTILIPAALPNKLSPEKLRAVLIHELAHIKRGDLWINSAQTLLQIIYFYSPLVWLANTVVRRIREQAVDEMVLVALGDGAGSYSNTLIDIAEMAFSRPRFSLGLVGVVESKKALHARVRHMLNRPIPKNAKVGALGTLLIMVVAAVFLPMAKAKKLNKPDMSVTGEHEKTSAKLLHQAAADGDIEQIRLLTSKGADLDVKDEMGWTPLHHASEHGHKDIAELLIAEGANINATDNKGATPADTAIPPLTIVTRKQVGQQQRVDVLKLLVAKGAQISTIQLAAFIGNMEKVKSFLEQGIDVNARDKDGRTPLHLASMSGHKEVVRFLIGKGADVNAQTTMFDLRPLHAAAMYLNLEVAKLLIDNGADVDTRPFWRAVPAAMIRMMDIYPNLDMKDADAVYARFVQTYWSSLRNLAELLLARGADVNEKGPIMGVTLLHYVAAMGLKDAVELFIARGADVNAKDSQGETPLWYAKDRGHEEIVKLLRKHGAKEATPGVSLRLYQAIAKGDMERVKSLIAKGADVNAKDKKGRTPLHAAARSGQKELVQLLLANGADVKTKDEGGWRPLDEAVNSGRKELVELLIEAGADVNVQGEAGYTPLQTACFRGHREVVELLTAKGADLEIENQLGQTALHVAAYYEHTEIVELLRKHGAKE